MLKTLSNFIGAVLVGFGLGIILAQNWTASQGVYLIILIVSLVAGGFFIAVGSRRRAKAQPKENLPREDYSSGTKEGEKI